MESRLLQFIAALRASGVRISLAESSEAFSAVDVMGIQDRQAFRLSLQATLIKDAKDLPTFQKLFALFFASEQPPLPGSNLLDEITPEEARLLAEALRQLSEDLRRQIERLMKGEPLSRPELERLAHLVGLEQMGDLNYQNWMAQRMLRALAFPKVREALRDLMEQLAQMGMSRARLERLRQMLLQNMQGIQEQVERFAGQRLAENLSRPRHPADLDGLFHRPFQALSEAEKKLLQREVKRLVAALRTRIALRQKRARSGRLDPKATLRANLKYHGVPMEIRHRDRIRKPKIVALCDISTSMRFCSELMLSFLFALHGQVHKMHAFAFIDHLEYISDDLGDNVDEAIASLLWRMPGGHYNTDLGWALQNFNDHFMDTLNSQTTLILVGDGRNNYNDPRLDLFSLMARRVARTIWLNPEPPALWHGDSDMPKYAPLCSHVLKVSNLNELIQAVDTLMSA